MYIDIYIYIIKKRITHIHAYTCIKYKIYNQYCDLKQCKYINIYCETSVYYIIHKTCDNLTNQLMHFLVSSTKHHLHTFQF